MVNIMEGNVALLTFLTSFIQFKERCLMSKQTALMTAGSEEGRNSEFKAETFIYFIYLFATHNKIHNKQA